MSLSVLLIRGQWLHRNNTAIRRLILLESLKISAPYHTVFLIILVDHVSGRSGGRVVLVGPLVAGIRLKTRAGLCNRVFDGLAYGRFCIA